MADEVPNTKFWCENALSAVLSLWDAERNQAYRDVKQYQKAMTPGSPEQRLRPTVTYSSIVAMADAGLFLEGTKLDGAVLNCEPAQLIISAFDFQPNADQILTRVVD